LANSLYHQTDVGADFPEAFREPFMAGTFIWAYGLTAGPTAYIMAMIINVAMIITMAVVYLERPLPKPTGRQRGPSRADRGQPVS
jgi:hypothetical protein